MNRPLTLGRNRHSSVFCAVSSTVAGALALTCIPAAAQEANAAPGPTPDYLERLKDCQTKQDDDARLACFDAAVGQMVDANEKGDVEVVDREDVRKTKRQLFGFSLPKIKLFGGPDGEEDDKDKLFETTITRARYLSAKKARFTTAEGAVWEMKNIPRRLRKIKAGDTVKFKQASLGYYFIRIGGQMGVKGRRIQ